MSYLLIWWTLIILLGLAAFPVSLRLLACLPDRGYTVSKPLSLLLVAYPFWLLTSLGLLENTFGVIAFLVLLLAALAWGYGTVDRRAPSPAAWLRANWRFALAAEILFSVAFFAFAYYRAFNPEIQATEKPMEFMFLNSILKSPTFPPHDAWLSGYGVSYYYLGYVIVALLTRLTAAPSSYAFNLGLILVYATTAMAAFGLVYNLCRGLLDRAGNREEQSRGNLAPYVAGVFAAFLLLVAGNLEAPFESLHNLGIGSGSFYQALDINGLAEAPRSGSAIPSDNWWWWRASRVVNDHDPSNGSHIEVIDEFPSFSFLLGDLHPHVLALPFGILALAVALNLYLLPSPILPLRAEISRWLTPGMLLTGVILGSLALLNTWDIVTYGLIIIAAYALAQSRAAGRLGRSALIRAGIFGAGLLGVSILLYLPFFFGFSSQAGGILPTIIFKTPLHQYLIMFGLFVFVLASWILILVWLQRAQWAEVLGEAATWVFTFFAVPVAIAVVGIGVLAFSRDLRERVLGLLRIQDTGQVGTAVLSVLQQYSLSFAYSLALFLLLVVLMSLMIALVRRNLNTADRKQQPPLSIDENTSFALLLAFIAFFLTFGVEFLYVRDTFGTRMNTVFKLYFQAWTLFSIAGAFGALYVMRTLRGAGRAIWVSGLGVLVALALVFPVLAYPNRSNGFTPNPTAGTPTLDGTRWIQSIYPDDYAAIEWLNANAPDDAVILEAPGGEYSFYDRVSMATGLATIVGWGGHELQWRGTGDEADRRDKQAEAVYTATDPAKVQPILAEHGVRYVIVGSLEREKYKLSQPMIDKFGRLGALVFEQGSMRIYEIGPAQ